MVSTQVCSLANSKIATPSRVLAGAPGINQSIVDWHRQGRQPRSPQFGMQDPEDGAKSVSEFWITDKNLFANGTRFQFPKSPNPDPKRVGIIGKAPSGLAAQTAALFGGG